MLSVAKYPEKKKKKDQMLSYMARKVEVWVVRQSEFYEFV